MPVSRKRVKKAPAKKRSISRKKAPKKAQAKPRKKPLKKKATKKKAPKKFAGKKAAKKRPAKKKAAKKPIKKAAAKKKPAKKKTAKKPIKKAAAKKKSSAGSFKQRTSSISRPIPKIKARTTRKIFTTSDIARMTKPGDIENILSQLSDVSKEVQAVEATKFDIGVKHNGMALAEQELPSEYGVDRAILLVVDPTFVFTYWEVKKDSLQEAARRVGNDGKLTLRFYDVGRSNTPEQSNFWDVEVFDRLGNWYLRLAHPEQNICLDIGVKNSQGHFYRIIRSNLVRLPQQSLAKPGPIKWMVVTPSGEKSISDVEEYTDADLTLLKKIMGPYFFDLLMRGRLASITGSSVEAIFYDVDQLKEGASPSGTVPWTTP